MAHSLVDRSSPALEHPNISNLRIVLLGKSVSENSRVGNFLLERAAFDREAPPDVVERVEVRLKDRYVTIINSPQLLQTNISDYQITQTVRECVNLSDPGPHAFIIIMQYNDLTDENMTRVHYVLKKFSEEAIKRTIIFTIDEETFDSHMSHMTKHTTTHQLIKECEGKHLQLEKEKSEWHSNIFQSIDMILKGNQEDYLTCELYEDVKGTSVEDQSSSEEGNEESSHHNYFEKAKDSQKGRSGKVDLRGKQKLNLVLCGSDSTLTVSVLKLLQGKKIKLLNQRKGIKECVKKEKIHGYKISLVELPALDRLSKEEVMRQTLRCVFLCHPGVHVFILIVPVGLLTDEDKAEIEKMIRIFDSREHFIVLFTSSFSVEGPVMDFIKSSPESQKIIGLCGGRYRVIGLNEPENSRQIPDLLDYIENMKTEPYSLQMYVKAQENRARHELEEQNKKELKRMEDEIKELKQKIQSYGAEGEADDDECLRIVLIGRTGNGKSATGNTILGRNEFQSQLSTDSVTTVCEKGVGEVDGRSVAVVDTPGLFDTSLSHDQVVEEIVKCISMSLPGPHVFVIVLSLGRFIQVEIDTVDLIKKIFGRKAVQFSIVLFTRGDDLEEESIEDYVKRSKSAELKKLIRDCGNRFLVFNNKEKRDRTQVTQLLNMIEELKNTNEGRYFTNSMFEEAEMSIKRRMDEILKEREREIQTEREELQAKYEMDMKNLMKRLEEEKQRADEERMKMQNQFREKLEKLRKEFEEKEKTEQKKQEIENQKRSEEEKQQRAEYNKKIEEMKRERLQYEKQQKKREEEDRKREEKYRQDQEKMKNEQECIIFELRMKQEKETKRRETEEQRRNKEEDDERQRWETIIKEAENERKEIQEEIKGQQREWEDEKKRQLREREEEEQKRREKHEEELREKLEELEKMRKRFEREREEERQKIEEERQKQRREKEEKEREYEEKTTAMKIHYEQLDRNRKMEWQRRKQEDDERQEEERKRWKNMIENLKQERELEINRREKEEMERKKREEKEQCEMKKIFEENIKFIKNKYQDEARKQAEELNDFRERKEQHIQELQQMLKERQEQHELLEKLYKYLQVQKDKEIEELLQIVQYMSNKCRCVIL